MCRDVVVIFKMKKVQKSTGSSTLSIAVSHSDKYGPEKDSHAPNAALPKLPEDASSSWRKQHPHAFLQRDADGPHGCRIVDMWARLCERRRNQTRMFELAFVYRRISCRVP